jgi:hypothetical protein
MAQPEHPPSNLVMRKPCPHCGNQTGTIKTVNGQDTVRCASCGQFCYNAPKTETGRAQRSRRTRPDIKPSQRTRILLRDNSTCVICQRSAAQCIEEGDTFDVGHLISVRDGKKMGLSDNDLNSDENLAAMCGSDNSGLSSETVPLRLAMRIFKARLINIEETDLGMKWRHENPPALPNLTFEKKNESNDETG